MRDRLVHKFWDINPPTLWSTVTEDFPVLFALLSTITVLDDPLDEDESFDFEVLSDNLLKLPDDAPGLARKAGHSLITIRFGHNGEVEVVRLIHDGSKGTILINKSDSLKGVAISSRPASPE